MSTSVNLPVGQRVLSPVDIEHKFVMACGDVESVTSSPDGVVVAFRDGVTVPLASTSVVNAHPFANLTAAQVDQWIQTNVTSLATVQMALQRLAEFCIYLRDRS